MPALFLFLFLVIDKKSPVTEKLKLSRFDQRFLIFVGLGPFFLTLLLSALTGIKLRAGWGQPLLTFWSLLLLLWFMPNITSKQFKRFFIASIMVSILTLIGYCLAYLRASAPSSANFPGKIIAKELQQDWIRTYHRPLNYIVGPRWLAGNVSFYSKHHPSVYIEANPKLSPWIDEDKLRKEGGIFVWDPTEAFQVSIDEIKRRYPELGPLKVMHFSWLRNPKLKPATIIKVAYLAPESP